MKPESESLSYNWNEVANLKEKLRGVPKRENGKANMRVEPSSTKSRQNALDVVRTATESKSATTTELA
jgi:hypothetical protein